MTADAELDLFRGSVNCAAILEGLGRPWRLDARESTRRALKYRRDEGEVLIITHEGRGWWDPQSTAKGDVFALVQHLDPSLNFGHVRQVLRRYVGIALRYTPAERRRGREGYTRSVAERWATRPRLRPGCLTWAYLTEERRLPPAVLELAAQQDAVRDGAYGRLQAGHWGLGHGPSFRAHVANGSGDSKKIIAVISFPMPWRQAGAGLPPGVRQASARGAPEIRRALHTPMHPRCRAPGSNTTRGTIRVGGSHADQSMEQRE
jgi:hypothetical protein